MDGAHNPDGIKALLDTVRFYFSDRRLIAVMGVLRDKDYEEMVRLSADVFQHIYTVTPDSPRALDAGQLQGCISAYHDRVTAMASVEDAVNTAVRKAAGKDVVLIFGSLSFLKQARDGLTVKKG